MTAAARARIGGATIDRSDAERGAPDLLDTLRRDPRTRVLSIRGDRSAVDAEGLVLLPVADVGDAVEWAFLGRSRDGRAILAAFAAAESSASSSDDAAVLREAVADLPAGDADAFVTAVALGRWLVGAPFCPACGTRMIVRAGGWARTCPSCGRDEFPRTDPAVIATVSSADDPDLLLLGSHAAWGQDRYSCFAGFVEAGESLEDTVVRELREEAGVAVTDLRYAGSQPWPYPRSLMLGFHARALDDTAARADGEEIAAVRWFTRAEIGAALAGEGDVLLPGPAAISHRLITQWYEDTP